MKLKGNLDSTGVAELFRQLADRRATGILKVGSRVGEKTVALRMGEIAGATDTFSERTRLRLAAWLVELGHLTKSQLVDALKAHKLNPRVNLGDLMVKRGMIAPQVVAEALKFQIEEQILELYGWTDAKFEFDGDKSVDDVYAPDNPALRPSVSVALLFQNAAMYQENWTHIKERVTPYLCFKATPKGEELISKTPRNTQAIFNLLKAGHPLDTVIMRSCVGRFNVCLTVLNLLDDAWILPLPADQIRFLAAEHRRRRLYLDALYIYCRLQDSVQSDADKAELERCIREMVDAIRDPPEDREILYIR